MTGERAPVEKGRANPFAASEQAALYDTWFETPLGGTVDRLERRLVYRLAQPRRGETALDVGTGTGHWAADLAHRGLRVTGVDSSEAMLAVAQRKGASVTWRRADAHALPFADGSFQLVLCVTMLEFVADPQAALNEMLRVTAPGGRTVVGVLNAESSWATFYRNQAAKADSPFGYAHLFTPAEFVALLSRSGRARWSSAVWVPPSGRGLAWAGWLEVIGRVLRRRQGALLVGRVDK